MQDHAVCALDLPVHSGVRHGGPIDADVVFIVESKELLSGELRAIVCDDGVWDPKAMDDVEEEQHSLLRLDRGDRLSLYPLCKLVYGDKQVRIAPGLSPRRARRSTNPRGRARRSTNPMVRARRKTASLGSDETELVPKGSGETF